MTDEPPHIPARPPSKGPRANVIRPPSPDPLADAETQANGEADTTILGRPRAPYVADMRSPSVETKPNRPHVPSSSKTFKERSDRALSPPCGAYGFWCLISREAALTDHHREDLNRTEPHDSQVLGDPFSRSTPLEGSSSLGRRSWDATSPSARGLRDFLANSTNLEMPLR